MSESSEDSWDESTVRTMRPATALQKCKHCGKLPFSSQRYKASAMDENDVLWDFEAGIYELLHKSDHLEAQENRIPPALAAKVAEKSLICVRRLQRQFIKAGLMHGQNQNFVSDAHHARIIAPFRLDEVHMGNLLGTGGFSSVYEVEAFEAETTLDVEDHVQEARAYLQSHAQREVVGPAKKKGGTKTTSRYAVKHLRRTLTDDPERFERAAIDLAQEAQLLLVMDHPNIISIRGWAHNGPGAYQSGRHHDYFLIIDRLPESLEDRMFTWRNDIRKYQAKLKIPWARKKFGDKIQAQFGRRLKVAYDIVSALEYMHDRRIINRDIKPGNAGFSVHGDLKIFDFGLSRLLPPESQRTIGGFWMSRVGTKYYMAPEVRNKLPYDEKADLYSFGVVMWEVLSVSTPRDTLHKKNLRVTREEVSQLPFCPCWPQEVTDLLEGLLSHDPEARPSAKDVRHVLLEQLEQFGFPHLQPRRRSTFRLDISQLETFKSMSTVDSTLDDYSISVRSALTDKSE